MLFGEARQLAQLDARRRHIIVRHENIRHQRHRGIDPIGLEIGHAFGGENFVDVTRSGHEIAGKKALAAAGWNIKDVRSFHPYDDFLIAIVIQLDLCERMT